MPGAVGTIPGSPSRPAPGLPEAPFDGREYTGRGSDHSWLVALTQNAANALCTPVTTVCQRPRRGRQPDVADLIRQWFRRETRNSPLALPACPDGSSGPRKGRLWGTRRRSRGQG
jgi:hypothetical protein